MLRSAALVGARLAIADHNKGTAYTDLSWIQLVFGKTLVYDRTVEKDG